MLSESHSIGAVSRATGCKVQTIRYYEQIGLIRPAGRTGGNQRRYDADSVERLTFIRHARALGFSLDQVRELLALAGAPEQDCDPADHIARQNLAEVERRIGQLEALAAELRRMITECRGGRSADCRILEVLGDHGQCLTEAHVGPEATPPKRLSSEPKRRGAARRA